jgi:hypothetical protein
MPKKLSKAKQKADLEFLRMQGVNGTGIRRKNGEYVIVVYVSSMNEALRQAIPAELDGIKIHIEEIGEVRVL